MRKFSACLFGAGAVALAAASPISAQEVSPPQQPQDAVRADQANPVPIEPTAQGPATPAVEDQPQTGLADIVVYAQKKARGEQLQDVPVAVTAVDSRLLESSHAIDIRDVGRLVPNAQLDGVGTYPGFANFFMRGVGVSTSVRSLDPAVNIVQDGMVVGYQAGAVLDAFDTEGVEVLRGPQGVLFGRNASGGVVHLRSKRPSGDFGAEVRVTVGNAETYETRSSIEGSLIEGVLSTRVALLTRSNNGFFTNSNFGNFVVVPSNANPTGAAAAMHPVTKIPDTNEIVLKNTWVWEPSDGTTFTLFGQYLNFDNGGGPTRSYFIPGVTAPRPIQTAWGWTPTDEKWGVNLGNSGYTKIESWHLVGELAQDIGPGTLTVIGAYRDVGYNSTLNVSGDPFDILIFPDGDEDAKQASLEARYNVTLGDFDLLVGGFYYDLDTSVYEKRLQKTPASATNRLFIVNIWDQDVKSYAAFANVDWHITPELTLSGGLRYSKDKKKINILPLQTCPGQSYESCPRVFVQGQKSWDDFSPRVVANYKITPDIMVYGSYSRGYRAGNFNARSPTAIGAITPADPETVSSYEAGIKSDLLDNHLRVNLGYFYQKYDDIQRLVQVPILGSSPLQLLFNAAKATIQGLELETSVLPVTGLRFDANIGYTDAKYDEFNNLTGLQPGQDPTDLKFDRVPKWTAYVGMNYDTRIGQSDDRVTFDAGYTWRSAVFMDVLNLRELRQSAYGLFNASASYRTGAWTATAFGRNIFDREYAEIKSAGLGYNAFGGSRRYYGLEVGYKF